MKPAKLPKPIKSKNPVVILRHVIKAIKEEPKRYDQGTYIDRRDLILNTRDEDDFPRCGTICCVAGWVNVIKGKGSLPYDDMGNSAQRILGLDDKDADELFDGDPEGVRPRCQVTPRQHAADGIKHIKRFVLKKWGKKL